MIAEGARILRDIDLDTDDFEIATRQLDTKKTLPAGTPLRPGML